MTPTGVAVLLMVAYAVDYISIGPNWLRDRVAFLMAIASWREGFNGSPLDRWTVHQVTNVIDTGLNQAKGAYIAAASANAILGVLVGALFVYAVGALLPTKLSGRLGRVATINFPQSGIWQVNWRLQLVAALLGMMADLPAGNVGSLTIGCVNFLCGFFAPFPAWLLGGA
ncbi:hypothetical protein [Winogradskya humida]|uniref:Uncharacterized protein n=1 Tax=Winogradskya humida TaxID=113566 RepID=A0ABQ4A789_9ACTN|nr:hypothetical protein [Actinoplanes humidus]GIE26727.1 hypothetical protein Ahu01nite_098290 [Actinoplanes humidus]